MPTVFEIALESQNFQELMSVANSLLKKKHGISSRKKAKTIFQKAAKFTNKSEDLIELAFYVGHNKHLCDKLWAKKLLQKAVSLIEIEGVSLEARAINLCSAATLINNPYLLNDKSWAKKLFLKAIQVAEDIEESLLALTIIAKVICYQLSDHSWAKKLYKKLLRLNKEKYVNASTIFKNENIREQMKESCINLIINVAQEIADQCLLNDRRWAIFVVNDAISWCEDNKELVRLNVARKEFEYTTT